MRKLRVGAKYDSVMKNIERFIKIRDQEGYQTTNGWS